MKTKWITPRTEIEAFVPNEYIAACWGVACDWPEANQYEKTHGPGGWKTWWDLGCTHDASHCGQADNQIVYDDDKDGKADRMIETGTDGLGDLVCNITNMNINNVRVGSYIHWTTSATDGRVWHHQGTVIDSVPGHPNASI